MKKLLLSALIGITALTSVGEVKADQRSAFCYSGRPLSPHHQAQCARIRATRAGTTIAEQQGK
jgi:hypothetical protein